jgi:hypothetical protein
MHLQYIACDLRHVNWNYPRLFLPALLNLRLAQGMYYQYYM